MFVYVCVYQCVCVFVYKNYIHTGRRMCMHGEIRKTLFNLMGKHI